MKDFHRLCKTCQKLFYVDAYNTTLNYCEKCLFPNAKRTLNWDFIKKCLASRREARRMTALGYRQHETDWEIHRGDKYGQIIVDAKVSVCGRYVWTKIGRKE